VTDTVGWGRDNRRRISAAHIDKRAFDSQAHRCGIRRTGTAFILGISLTAIRLLMRSGVDWVKKHDLSKSDPAQLASRTRIYNWFRDVGESGVHHQYFGTETACSPLPLPA
jgi:acyl-coenzyme A synthetase/AMP-(fatty) acid ligase